MLLKRLSISFFNLIFSGAFLVISYYYSMTPGHIETFYAHLATSALGFSILCGLFIFFRNAFDLPDGHDFFGLNRISPLLSAVFAVLILFVLVFQPLQQFLVLQSLISMPICGSIFMQNSSGERASLRLSA